MGKCNEQYMNELLRGGELCVQDLLKELQNHPNFTIEDLMDIVLMALDTGDLEEAVIDCWGCYFELPGTP